MAPAPRPYQAATLVFDGGILALKGGEAAFDFLAAYFVEDSLSVDNLFVFLLLFRYFKVPPQLVDICLNYGTAAQRHTFLANVGAQRPRSPSDRRLSS